MQSNSTRRAALGLAQALAVVLLFWTTAVSCRQSRNVQTAPLSELTIPLGFDAKVVSSYRVPAYWQGAPVLVYWTAPDTMLVQRFDGTVIAQFTAYMHWLSTPPNVLVQGDSLYVLFYDSKRGWLLSVLEPEASPTVVPVLPGNLLTYDSAEDTLALVEGSEPSEGSFITMRFSDLIRGTNGSVEGVVALPHGGYFSEHSAYAYFWFRALNGEVEHVPVITDTWLVDFRAIPRDKMNPASFLWLYGDHHTFRLAEVLVSDSSSLSVGREVELTPSVPEDRYVDTYEAIAFPSTGEIVLFQRYRAHIKWVPEPEREPPAKWKVSVIDRSALTLKTTGLAVSSAFTRESPGWPRRVGLTPDNALILGYVEGAIDGTLGAPRFLLLLTRDRRLRSGFLRDVDDKWSWLAGVATDGEGNFYVGVTQEQGTRSDRKSVVRLYEISVVD